jgi:hypothetical protein
MIAAGCPIAGTAIVLTIIATTITTGGTGVTGKREASAL